MLEEGREREREGESVCEGEKARERMAERIAMPLTTRVSNSIRSSRILVNQGIKCIAAVVPCNSSRRERKKERISLLLPCSPGAAVVAAAAE